MKRELTCIGCPLGCQIEVEMEHDKILSIGGYSCSNGKRYAESEVIEPKRILTTSIRVADSSMCSVKTREPIPKDKLMAAMATLKDVTLTPPIRIGDVVYKNILNTGVDVVATRNILAKEKPSD